MAQATGANAQLLLDFETAFGSDPGTPDALLMPINSSGLVPSRTLNTAATITGSRNPVAPFSGNESVSGSIVIPMDSIGFAHWCRAMFDDPATSGSDPYEHVFKISDTQPSLVLEQGHTDINQYHKYNGCKVNQFSMTCGGDGELTASLDMVGASFSRDTSAYDATPTSVSLARLNNFQAAIQEGGSTISDATEISITVAFNLDSSNYTIGSSGSLGSLPEGIVGVSGSLTALFEDATYLTKAMAGTESSLKLTLTDGSSSIVEFYIPELKYEVAGPAIDGPTGIKQTLNFQGYYDDNSDATSFMVTITNGVASY